MKTRQYLTLPLICAFVVIGAATLNAQATRTWVSGVGDDVNPCSRTAPCKTFAGAISKTAEGGEIDPLDPGGYGTLTINKAITIDGGTGGGWASVLNTGGIAGFNVNITTGTHVNDAVVILRNITVNGASQSPSVAGLHGVNFIKGANLIVENCVFENQSTTGITETLATSGVLRVNDCFFDNTNIGITVTTSAGTSAAHLDHCRFNALAGGVKTTSNAFVTIRDCFFAQTTSANGGVLASTGCQINVTNSTFSRNNIGANMGGGIIRLSNNDFYDNASAISGGTAESANNNRFRNNAADGSTSNVIVVK
jgi:hypothetical protein